MATKEINSDKARFDTRISREQKEFFERAARIGGYRSLTDFVVITVQEKAKEIIAEKEQVLNSQKDSEVFFNAIMNAPEPNTDLLKAAAGYKDFLSE